MTNTARPNQNRILDWLVMDDFVNTQVYWSAVANL